MDNFEMLINICKNWFDNARVGGSPSSIKKITKMKQVLIDKNEDVIASSRLLDMDENNYKVWVSFVSYFLHFLKSFFLSKFDICVHQKIYNQLVFFVGIGLRSNV
jgi:hypothetical protein